MGENYPICGYFNQKLQTKQFLPLQTTEFTPIFIENFVPLHQLKQTALGNAKSSSFTYTNKLAMVSIGVSKPLFFYMFQLFFYLVHLVF